jgi:hypothetical protein
MIYNAKIAFFKWRTTYGTFWNHTIWRIRSA